MEALNTNEQKTAEEVKEETTAINSDTRDIQSPSSIIDRADQIREKLENAIKRNEEILQRQEAVAARLLLAGQAQAGSINKTPEQIKQEEEDARVKAILAKYK